ncbi:MAG: hypothetical protein ACI90V_011551 [Bacillariaceae sp.]|jgi:hypothetical protein
MRKQQKKQQRRRRRILAIFVFAVVISILTQVVSFLRFESSEGDPLSTYGDVRSSTEQRQREQTTIILRPPRSNEDGDRDEKEEKLYGNWQIKYSKSQYDETMNEESIDKEYSKDDDDNDSDEVQENDRSEGEETSAPTEEESDDNDTYFKDPNAEVADWDYFPKAHQKSRLNTSSTDVVLSLHNKKINCDLFMKDVETTPPAQRKPSNEACEGYNGVLHIHHFDRGGASGTAFFLFTVGMLNWADQHNYLPWIHIEDGYTKPIWDNLVHNSSRIINYDYDNRTFTMKTGMDIGWFRDQRDKKNHIFPGRPFLKEKKLHSKEFFVHGTGVWEHYFHPPTDFVPGDTSCRNKPLVKFNDDHIVPGIHANAPWAPRAWRYGEAPYIIRKDLSWDEWFEPQRRHAAETTRRYIRFNPMMERRALCSLPNPEFSLGMHIRHGDKYLERDIIKPKMFLIFAEAFVNNGGGSIYLATDSAKVVKTILKKWPKHVADHIVLQPSVLGLTRNKTAAFDIGISPHRTNVEALTDVLALSKCTFVLHGLSAMSEAVLFINPGLIKRSVNLEDIDHRSVDYFINTIMPRGRKVVNGGQQ